MNNLEDDNLTGNNINSSSDSEFFLNFPDEDSQETISRVIDDEFSSKKLPLKVIIISLLALMAVAVAFWGSFKLGKLLFSNNSVSQSAYNDVYSGKDSTEKEETVSDSQTIIPKDNINAEEIENSKAEEINTEMPEDNKIVTTKEELKKPIVTPKPESTLPKIMTPPKKIVSKAIVTPKTAVKKATVVKPVLTPVPTVKHSGLYDIIAGSYSSQQTALIEVRKLASLGFKTSISSTSTTGKTTYRVHIGSKLTREEARPLQGKAKTAGYETFLLPR